MQFCKRGEGWVVVSGVMLVSHYLVGLGWVGLGWVGILILVLTFVTSGNP